MIRFRTESPMLTLTLAIVLSAIVAQTRCAASERCPGSGDSPPDH